mmetsp:Transcript_19408/g.35102  ORF Transcript_19408/g.35102 Transcript_19408/m.35102 type:complete len:252 (-) Transcript_19408:1333-2088(-)
MWRLTEKQRKTVRTTIELPKQQQRRRATKKHPDQARRESKQRRRKQGLSQQHPPRKISHKDTASLITTPKTHGPPRKISASSMPSSPADSGIGLTLPNMSMAGPAANREEGQDHPPPLETPMEEAITMAVVALSWAAARRTNGAWSDTWMISWEGTATFYLPTPWSPMESRRKTPKTQSPPPPHPNPPTAKAEWPHANDHDVAWPPPPPPSSKTTRRHRGSKRSNSAWCPRNNSMNFVACGTIPMCLLIRE